MGRPKLLLDVRGEPLIGRVIRTLREGGADRVLVVCPPNAEELARVATEHGAETMALQAPSPDMRSTVEQGVAHLALDPVRPLGILLAPADSVGMTCELVAAVVERMKIEPNRIVVPRCGERRGHPLGLPWAIAEEIRGLPAEVGINALVRDRPLAVVEVPWADPTAAADLDTPEDYSRWTAP